PAAATHIAPLSLHDALPISPSGRGIAILAVGPAGILPADKCAKATGKMPIFPTAKMAMPRRLARFLRATQLRVLEAAGLQLFDLDRKSTRLNSSHVSISYAV